LGNLPEKAPAFKPPAYTPAEDESSAPKDQAWFDKKTEEELEDLEDDKDLDDDRFLEEYRKKRLSELREAAKVKRYGTVTPISGSDFVIPCDQDFSPTLNQKTPRFFLSDFKIPQNFFSKTLYNFLDGGRNLWIDPKLITRRAKEDSSSAFDEMGRRS
jgi:hypothetical protein